MLGEVSGGTCADMVGPWGPDYTAGSYYCDVDTCAETCAEYENDYTAGCPFDSDSTIAAALRDVLNVDMGSTYCHSGNLRAECQVRRGVSLRTSPLYDIPYI